MSELECKYYCLCILQVTKQFHNNTHTRCCAGCDVEGAILPVSPALPSPIAVSSGKASFTH